MLASVAVVHGAKAQLIHLNGGSTANITAPTPQQLAVNKKIDQLNNEAIIAINAGKYSEAEADIRNADSIAPGSYMRCGDHGTLAAALDAEGKDQEALKEYKKIVDAGTTIPDYVLPYALLMIKSGHASEAVAAYNRALPNVAYANLLRVNGDLATDTSRTELEAACRLARGLVYYDRGIVGAESRYDLALDQFQKARQLSANPALAELYSGYALKWLNLNKQAHDAFAKAQELGQEDVKRQAAAAMYGTSIDP